ncbi:MAG: dockerin type I repeat-containing protein [Clostridia bacterium]|nr:dockerin type I repeat-containing protein [Clostridia bacterium]
MKKRFLKVLSIVMCLVVLCASFSLSSSALTIQKNTVSELEGLYAYNYMTNSDESLAFFELEDIENGDYKYAYTADGINYEFVDFEIFAPECDYLELADCLTDGETFVFLFYCYKIENVFDPEFDEYIEDYKVIDSYFITTKDFLTFEQHRIEVETDEQIYQGSYIDYSYYGLLKNIDGEWLFANGDYIVTGSVEYEKTGKGVYYTTKDFESWNVHYTQEDVVWSDMEYYFTYYDAYDAVFAINEYSENEAYFLIDGEVYGPVSPNPSEDEEIAYELVCVDSGSLSALRIESIYTDEYYESEDGYADSRFVSIDLKTGEETVIYEGVEDFYHMTVMFNDCVYLNVLSYEDESVKNYEITKDFSFKTVETPFFTDDSLVSYYMVGSTCYEVYEDKVLIYDRNLEDYTTVDFSDSLLIITYDMFIFKINGKLVVLDTSSDGGKAYAFVTDADLIKVGDVNADKAINSADALKVLQHATGLAELNEYEFSKADTNKNGEVNSADALTILQYATGLVSKI